MNHIVILDTRANEIENLLKGTKSMIIRGADVMNIPYGMVNEGDVLYFVNNNDCTEIKAKAVVSTVYNSFKLSVAESYELIIRNQDKLSLPDDLFYKWAGKKYLILIKTKNIEEVHPFNIEKIRFLNTDDWYPVENIEDLASRVRKTA